MKLLPTPRPVARPNTEDALGHGMDAVIVIALFLGLGYGLDRLAGTMPVFMIVMTVLGCIGLFAKFKYSYELRMNEHEAARLAKLAGPAPTTTSTATSPTIDGASATGATGAAPATTPPATPTTTPTTATGGTPTRGAA